jgi:hypothetical protein
MSNPNDGKIVLPHLVGWVKDTLDAWQSGKGWKEGQVPTACLPPYVQPTVNFRTTGGVHLATVRFSMTARGPEKKAVGVPNAPGEPEVVAMAEAVCPLFDNVKCLTVPSRKLHIAGIERVSDIHLVMPEKVGQTTIDYVHVGGLYIATLHRWNPI